MTRPPPDSPHTCPLVPARTLCRSYIESVRRDDPVETAAENALLDLAYARDLPLVATNPVCYAESDFHAAHDAMLCIADSAYVESNDRRTSCSHEIGRAHV